MKDGFFTALGTPIEENGDLVENSFTRHVDDQIEQGASGLLVMGSMGNEPGVKYTEYPKVARVAAETARGRCPVLVGVMDNSIANVKGRIDSLRGLDLEGVVCTAPFYSAATQAEHRAWFSAIAKDSPFLLYLYDLPTIVKSKITVETVEFLMRTGNVGGIKTGDIYLARALLRSPKIPESFNIVYSGLDAFDVAFTYGICKNLDGMFSCTASTARRMFDALRTGDRESAAAALDNIIALRNVFIETGIMNGFTYAMNLLGYPGIFAIDYEYIPTDTGREKVREAMQRMKML